MSDNIVHCEHGYFSEPDGPCPHCLELASLHRELAQWKSCAERLAKEMVTFAADFHGRYGYEHCTAKDVRAEFDRLKAQSK